MWNQYHEMIKPISNPYVDSKVQSADSTDYSLKKRKNESNSE